MPFEVAITGVGMVSPLGLNAAACATAWTNGACAARSTLPALQGTPLETVEVGVLPSFDPARCVVGGRRMLRYMSPAAVLGCLAAHESLQDAGAKERYFPEQIGLYAATGLASAGMEEVAPILAESIGETGQFSCRLFGDKGLAVTNPLLSFKLLANMPACLISIVEEIRGPNLIFAPWEGQCGGAFLEAWHAVATGAVPAVLTGAAEDAATPVTLTTLRQTGRLKENEYPASGAAYLFLERADRVPDTRRCYAVIKNIHLSPDAGPPEDPLAQRIGRTFVAAPALLLALAARLGWDRLSINGEDHVRVVAELEPRL